MDHKHHQEPSSEQRKTNWRPILLWSGVILVLALVAMNLLSPIWLFAIMMIACHLGHSMMGHGGGRHH